MPKTTSPLPHVTHLSAPDEAVAGSRLSIDLAALIDNYHLLANMATGAECAAVIKADAYGIGLEPAAQSLWSAGCRTFFVAHPQEGARTRALVPDAVIYVLNGLVGDDSGLCADYYRNHGLRPVLGCLKEIEIWQNYCAQNANALPCALHFDTGMRRLGLPPDHAPTLAVEWQKQHPSFSLALIISHLACADEPEHPLNAEQLEIFGKVRAYFPDVKASLANSGGIMLGPEYHFDLCRPGIALYGGAAKIDGPNPMKAVAHLESRVLSLQTVTKGNSVSYGATQHTKQDSRLATLCVGYADGYLRAASSSDQAPGGTVWFNGHLAPIVGRVTMDLIIVDVTDIPHADIQRGDFVELFGANLAIDDVAKAAGTIGYELLTSLGLRAFRRYL